MEDWDDQQTQALVATGASPEMDEAIERAVAGVTGAGLISAGANRKAMRVAQESRDLFRRYMALYCREQANCHFSPALTANLERNWRAKALHRA